MNQVRRHVVVIGASSAIGAALAQLYAAEGAHFFLVARDLTKLEAVAADLAARGAEAIHLWRADLGNMAEIVGILPEARRCLPGLDLVIVAHGVLGPAADSTAEKIAADFFVNLTSVAIILEGFAAYLFAARRGSIIALGSVAGDRGRQSNYLYGATKAGVEALLSGLRNRLYSAGVNVLTVKPGFVDTPMTAAVPKNALFASPAQVAKSIYRAEARGVSVLYTPGFWWLIMLIIKSLPEFLFKRLKL